MDLENQGLEEYSDFKDRNKITNGRLQEIRFWVTIMKEHAQFIALGLPCDQTALIAEAESFVKQFGALEEKVKRPKLLTPSC